MDKNNLWALTLQALLQNASEDDLKSVFLNKLTPGEVFGNLFVFQASTVQVKNWVEENYLQDIKDALQMVSGTAYDVGIIASAAPAEQEQPQKTRESAVQPTAAPVFPSSDIPAEEIEDDIPDFMTTFVSRADIERSNRQHADQASSRRSSSYRNSTRTGNEALFAKCTFDTFVVGKTNEFARNAAMAVAEQPGVAYNPVFIYGNSGLGKTHLLVAIANYTMQNFPEMVTQYVAASRFFDDYMSATRNHDFDTFNDKYRHVDILLIDDLQYLVAHHSDSLLDLFFEIFNDMTNQSKQIVLCADRAPHVLEMDKRMTSRFSSGLVADIKLPDYETRLAILKNYYSRVKQVSTINATIPEEVFDYLAQVSTSNIRVMEGAVNNITSKMSYENKSIITVEEAQEYLKDFFPDTDDEPVDVLAIQKIVEDYFDITHEELISSSRKTRIMYPRHIAIYLSRFNTEETLESIGKKFGGRDHTTIIHSVSKIEAALKEDRKLYNQLEELTARIKGQA